MVRHQHLRSLLAGALLCVLPGSGFAQNADVTAALTEASKIMQQGAHVKAIELIDTALKSGKIQADLAAKALLMRAEANEKLGRSAFALADYNSAMWMQGLSASDRKRAEEGQARVMQGLGVAPRPAEQQAAPSQPANAGRRPGPPPQQQAAAPEKPRETPPNNPNTGVQETPSEERTGGFGSIFGDLFGSSAEAPRQPAPAAAQQTAPPSNAAAVVTTAPAPRGQQQAARPETNAPAASKPSVAVAQAPAVSPARQVENGSFTIQFAALAEEDKAIAEADRIGRKFGADLGGRNPSLMIVPTSDGGTLYKVVAGAFQTKGEGQAACELLKSKGVSCMVITRK